MENHVEALCGELNQEIKERFMYHPIEDFSEFLLDRGYMEINPDFVPEVHLGLQYMLEESQRKSK
jgi:hypothetical protein